MYLIRGVGTRGQRGNCPNNLYKECSVIVCPFVCKFHLNNYFNFHVRLSFCPSSIRLSVRPPSFVRPSVCPPSSVLRPSEIFFQFLQTFIIFRVPDAQSDCC